MIKFISGCIIPIVVCFFVSLAHAEVLRVLDFQTIVYDENGNVTQDEFVDVNIQIVDENNTPLFEEDHFEVPVTNGAVKLDIGETLGGVPSNVLNPTDGRKFLNVRINETSPFSLLPLSSVPYSIWSDKAMAVADGSITANSLQDGIVEARHFSPNFDISSLGGSATDAQIPEGIARDTEVIQDITNAVNNLQAVGVQLDQNGTFAAQLGETVQIAMENLFTRIGEETGARIAADSDLQSQVIQNQNNIDLLLNRPIPDVGVDLSTQSGSTTTFQSAFSRLDTRVPGGNELGVIQLAETIISPGEECKPLTAPVVNMWLTNSHAD
ncbi:MAG: hypothetical protein COX62_08170, partial [Deltaproteobacteria bacterium CG_4_10_14_0_2_um_filter_43_8]